MVDASGLRVPMDPPEERSNPKHNVDDSDGVLSNGISRGVRLHGLSDNGDSQNGEEAASVRIQRDARREDGQDVGADGTSASYLIEVRRALQDDFDRHMRRGCDGDDDSRIGNNDEDFDPYRRFDEDYDEDDDEEEDHDEASDDGLESMRALEEMERSLDYHDYLDREIDAYLEEPMRQLMREMEKEMDVSYLDDLNDEDGYYIERKCDVDRNRNDLVLEAMDSTDLRGTRESSSAGASSTYASVQASIQHAIACYKNRTLASPEV